MILAPLEDPTYEPRYRPVNGKPNPIVARWGPRSQVRWFARFWGTPEMPVLYHGDASAYYCHSPHHKGPCCSSCLEDFDLGYDWPEPGHCCCRSGR